MALWGNRRLTVYHGTDSISAGFLKSRAVNLALCAPFTDFGQGFYTTTRLHQAKQWANLKTARSQSTSTGPASAEVVAYDIDRDWLGSLDTLAFVRATRDFWRLVTDCRGGYAPHQRNAPWPVPYDVVHGPVTLWPQTLLISDCDQISFHTTRAVTGLGHAKPFAKAGRTRRF